MTKKETTKQKREIKKTGKKLLMGKKRLKEMVQPVDLIMEKMLKLKEPSTRTKHQLHYTSVLWDVEKRCPLGQLVIVLLSGE